MILNSIFLGDVKYKLLYNTINKNRYFFNFSENTCIFDEVNVIGLCPLPNEYNEETGAAFQRRDALGGGDGIRADLNSPYYHGSQKADSKAQ